MSQADDLKDEIAMWTRRLQNLKKQQARLGINTPPEIITEIEDIEAKLEQLYTELQAIGNNDDIGLPRTKGNRGGTDMPSFLIGWSRLEKLVLSFISVIFLVALCVCVGFLLINQDSLKQFMNLTATEETVTVHVSDQTGASISGANVLLFFEHGALSKYTDANGTTSFTADFSKEANSRVIVETDQYEIYEREIQLPLNTTVEVRLKKSENSSGSVIVRVVDDNNSIPISGADVLVLVEGEIYNQPTDTNGIAKYPLTFSENKIDAQISVSTKNYKIDYQRVTLLPNRVQDIRLNPNTNELKVTAFEPSTPTPPATSATNTTSISYGQILSGATTSPTEIDRYTFTGNANDVILIKIAKTSGQSYTPQIRLFGLDGKEIQKVRAWPNVSAELSQTLPTSGEYIIFVEDGWDGTQTGEYTLNLQKIR